MAKQRPSGIWIYMRNETSEVVGNYLYFWLRTESQLQSATCNSGCIISLRYKSILHVELTICAQQYFIDNWKSTTMDKGYYMMSWQYAINRTSLRTESQLQWIRFILVSLELRLYCSHSVFMALSLMPSHTVIIVLFLVIVFGSDKLIK